MSNRKIFLASVVAACLSAVACVATLIEPQWFELVFDESPDGGDGSLETIVAVALSAVACVFFTLLAWRQWRRDRNARAVSVGAGSRPG